MPLLRQGHHKMTRKEYGSKTNFFWKKRLYKILQKTKNHIYAWDVAEEKRVVFDRSSWERNYEKIFSNAEVCEILGRKKHTLLRWIKDGDIKEPFYVGVRTNDIYNRARYWWTEDDILGILDYLEELELEGDKRASKVPSKAEVRALLNNSRVVTYRKDSDGNFVPTYFAT